MNAGAYGMQIGSYVREVKLYRAASRRSNSRGHQISFEYRHTSFAPDDMMLSVILELPSKPFKSILEGIRICNEKRRSSQPLGQKSAGCIFNRLLAASNAGRLRRSTPAGTNRQPRDEFAVCLYVPNNTSFSGLHQIFSAPARARRIAAAWSFAVGMAAFTKKWHDGR